MTDADTLRRVWALLTAQRQNISQLGIYRADADRYHEQLDVLTAAGYDVEVFRLKPDDVFSRQQGTSGDGRKHSSDVQEVLPGRLEAKLDAILLYFQLDA